MCWLHRHQIHLISYGCVSFTLIATGLVFTIFAIFQKDSQIGKVWLAGPTTMVVGLVLCGKVIIDWGPAMLHGRDGSIDSFNQLNLPANSMLINYEPVSSGAMKAPLTYENAMFDDKPTSFLMQQHTAVGADKKPTMVDAGGHVGLLMPPSPSSPPTTGKCANGSADAGRNGAIDCIVYGPFDGVSTTNTPSRQSQTSHTDDGSNSLFKYDLRADTKSCEEGYVSRNGNCVVMTNKLPPPFPLTQTTLKTAVTTATIATQTYNSVLQPVCNCSLPSNTSEYYHVSARVRCCARCDKAYDEQTALDCTALPLRSTIEGNRTNISPYDQTTITQSKCQIASAFCINGLERHNFPYDETSRHFTTRVLMTPHQRIGNGPLYQGETFVVNDRNFFI